MKKPVKGTFGYLKTKKNRVLLMTIIYFSISLSLFIIGYATTKTKENLLTIAAVFGCLPSCKSLVSLFMYCRAKGCSNEAKDLIESYKTELVGMYDMYFTSYQLNFPVSHMVVSGKNICGYTEQSKCDTNACEQHLSNMLKQSGFKDETIKIFTDSQKYCDRLMQLNRLRNEEESQRDDEIRVVLYEISL